MAEYHVPVLSGPFKSPSPLQRLRYSPTRQARATQWAIDWRRRWFRNVGSVMQHHATGELVAFYSDDRDPKWRLALQAELETRPDGPDEVIAACRAVLDALEQKLIGGGR